MRINLSAIIISAAIFGSAAPVLAGGNHYPADPYAPSYAASYAPYGGPVYVAGYNHYRHAHTSSRQRFYAAPPRRFFWSQPYMGPVWRPGAHSYATIWD